MKTILAVLLIAMIPVSAQTAWPSCGEVDIVLRNSDLQPESDGAMHVAGQYFFHFQVIGENADLVDSVAMSLGPVVQDYDETACDQEVWFTGPYLMNFRADRDASDGYFLPAKTQDLPDGAFAGALHAYDKDGNEIGRSWGRAVIDNCDGGDGTRCDENAAELLKNDIGSPWPMILPGDGEAHEGKALSLEFAEPISQLIVQLNGVNISSEMTEWDGRVWDDDVIPDSSPTGGEGPTGPSCSHALDECIKLGPAYEWNGRPLNESDVLHIEATDMAGNTAVRDVHIGAAINGGALSADGAVLDISVDALTQSTSQGESVTFTFSMQNTGNEEAHPFTSTKAPSNWTAKWLDHEAVPVGAFATQELTVKPPKDALGDYGVEATIAWPVPGGEESRTWDLVVNVTGEAPATQQTQEVPEKESPMPVFFGLLAVGLALMLRRSRPAC